MPSSLRADNIFPVDAKVIASNFLDDEIIAATAVRGGGNNQIFKIETGSATYALKCYRQDLNDPRDRFATEIHAVKLLQQLGVARIPRFYAGKDKLNAALFEWIDGRPITHPTKIHIDNAIGFIEYLQNAKIESQNSAGIAAASEACFSIQEIVSQTETRLTKLSVTADPELNCFLTRDFEPAFKEITDWSKQKAFSSSIDYSREIRWEEQILSPSDFGFHNALLRKKSEVIFLDFEYFGWDDPTKMTADFVLHPGMTLSDQLIAHFIRCATELFADSMNFKNRLGIALPLYGLRWCMILLNEYLRNDGEIADEEKKEHLVIQLDKARAMLQKSVGFRLEYDDGS